MKPRHRRRLLAWAWLGLGLSPWAALAALPVHNPVPGGIALVDLGPSAMPRPSARFQEKPVWVTRQQDRWKAVVGLPLALSSGVFRLDWTIAGNTFAQEFAVLDKEYPAQYLRLRNRRMVDPDPDDLKRILRDAREIRAALAHWDETSEPALPFNLPAKGRLSSRFGLRRFFNRQPRKPHSGLDVAAPIGTPVHAPANATVIATGDYFFNGRAITLDHGQGLVTMYNHLHRIQVRKGQRVSRGEKIGEVGSSGRVTGAHLHWTVSLNDARVDPILFLEPALVRNLLAQSK